MNQLVMTPYQNEKIKQLEEELQEWKNLSFQITETLCIVSNNTEGYEGLIAELITDILSLRNKNT